MNKISCLAFLIVVSSFLLPNLSVADEKLLGKIPNDEMVYIQKGAFGNVYECWKYELDLEIKNLKQKGIDPNKELVIGWEQPDMPEGTLSISYWNINQNINCEPVVGTSIVQLTNYEAGEKFILCKAWFPGCSR